MLGTWVRKNTTIYNEQMDGKRTLVGRPCFEGRRVPSHSREVAIVEPGLH